MFRKGKGGNEDRGKRGEDFARRFLKKQGYRVLDANVRSALGEIDIVALEGDTICFVEVKTRRSFSAGSPEEAVNPNKIRRIVRAAKGYVARNRLDGQKLRYDVVAVREDAEGNFEGSLTRGAFYADGWG